MKKFLLSLIALLGVVSANAQELSIADVEVVPGTQATFAIVMNNETEMLFRDSEFHFSFPAGISPVGAAKGDQDLIPGENLIDGDYRVAISDNSGKGIGGTFTVCYVTIEAEAGLAEGTYQATLTKAEMTAKPSAEVYDVIKKNYENITFNIIVSNTVTLDENSTEVPGSYEGVNVLVKRSIKANQWSTICLPFAMTGDQVKAAFGDDVELADFNGYELADEDEITSITVKFTNVDASSGLAANHPCIIKVSEAVSEFNVENVTLEPEEDPTIAAVKRTKKQWSEMTGTYVAGTVLENNTLFLSNNKFYYSKGNTKMKGYRAFFDFYDVLAEVEAMDVKFQIFDGTTLIENIKLVDTAGAVYTVDGKFIGRDVDLKKLQKGIYVIDGKKVAIK